jgi:anti-anti-sigma factor
MADTCRCVKVRAQVSHSKLTLLKPPVRRSQHSLAVMRGPCSERGCVLHLEGPLCIPLNEELSQSVCRLLRRGEHVIVLDLSRVPKIDAAGVGELIRVYNMAKEANGVLQIARTTARVGEILCRVGLLDILTQG